MTEPRLLLVTLNFPPPLVGGARVYLHHILAHLPRGCATVLTTQAQGTSLSDWDQHQRYTTQRLHSSFSYQKRYKRTTKIQFFFSWMRALWKHIEKADVVVLANIFHLGMLTRFLCAVQRRPYIVIAFGEELSAAARAGNSLRSRLRRAIYGWTLKGARSIVSISRETSALVRAVTNAELTEIYPPTPLPATIPDARKVEAFRTQWHVGDKRIIASVGRLVRRKGFDYLVEAFPQVLARFPDTLLMIAGAGVLKAELQARVQALGIEESVRFLGQVTDHELQVLYAACEFFIMPNRTLDNGDQEGYGIVFNEANAFGKAVIGGRSGGTSSAIIEGETGLLVDSQRIDSVAEAMITLLQDRSRTQRMGNRGREWIANERSPERASAQFWECVKRTVQYHE